MQADNMNKENSNKILTAVQKLQFSSEYF